MTFIEGYSTSTPLHSDLVSVPNDPVYPVNSCFTQILEWWTKILCFTIFSWGCTEFSENSLSFPCLEKSLSIPGFPGLWPPRRSAMCNVMQWKTVTSPNYKHVRKHENESWCDSSILHSHIPAHYIHTHTYLHSHLHAPVLIHLYYVSVHIQVHYTYLGNVRCFSSCIKLTVPVWTTYQHMLHSYIRNMTDNTTTTLLFV